MSTLAQPIRKVIPDEPHAMFFVTVTLQGNDERFCLTFPPGVETRARLLREQHAFLTELLVGMSAELPRHAELSTELRALDALRTLQFAHDVERGPDDGFALGAQIVNDAPLRDPTLGELFPFGMCPECAAEDIDAAPGPLFLNVYKDRFAVCRTHQCYWTVGRNLFSSWKHETEQDWERNALELERYRRLSSRGDVARRGAPFGDGPIQWGDFPF